LDNQQIGSVQTIPPPITSAPPFAQGGLFVWAGFAGGSLFSMRDLWYGKPSLCWGSVQPAKQKNPFSIEKGFLFLLCKQQGSGVPVRNF